MAYLRSYVPERCKGYLGLRCGKPATKELVDRWNGSRGYFCAKCAAKALALQLKNEGAQEAQG